MSTISAIATLVTGFMIGFSPVANAADVTQTLMCITGYSMPGAPPSLFTIRNDDMMTGQWNAEVSPSWSPTLSGNFAANTVYSATVTLTTTGTYKFNNLSANAFTSNASCAGASGVSSITSPAVAEGSNLSSLNIVVTFADSGSGGGGGGTHVIASSSTVAGGAVNPTITITTDASMQAMPTGYNISVGTTGLTLWGISTVTARTAVFTFRGTAANGTLTIQVKTSGFVPTASADSNTLFL